MTRAPQVGDRIQVTGTVEHVYDSGSVSARFGADNVMLPPEVVAAGTLLPRPFKVGDRVHVADHHDALTATILVIDDDVAGIRWSSGGRGFYRLSDLTLADSEGQK